MATPRQLFRRRKKPGSAPGTLIHSGERKAETVRISMIDYDAENLSERTVESIKECAPYKFSDTVTWINIDGLHEISVLETLGKQYSIHPLVLEDVLSTSQRAKIEDYESYLYAVFRMITYDDSQRQIEEEQFSLILGSNFILTFQEKPGDVFDSVRQRLQNPQGRLRTMGPDYLAYALMDAIVDHYFVVLDGLGEQIIDIEEQLMNDPEEEDLETIHNLKREMIFLRKAIWPLREMVAQINRGESSLVTKNTQVFFRDVYDHTIQVVDTIESYRDTLSSLLDLYLSTLSNRMNEVMKVLTIIATIFIPLTFIAGIYGMNFAYMPELQWRWAYPAVWLIMSIVAIIMLIFFKRKRWL